MALSDDQRAMLRLLAQREQGYEDIAALMGLSVGEIRARVRAALEELDEAPAEAAAPPPLPERQLREPDRADSSVPAPPPEPERAPQPRPEAAGEPAATPPPPTATSSGRAPLSTRQRQLIGAVVGVGAVVVLIVLLVAGAFDGGSSKPTPSASTTTAASGSQQLTQAVLAPVNGGSAQGRALFGRLRNTPVLQVTAQGLAPSPPGQSYTVWLYRSPTVVLRVGAVRVGKSGGIAAQFPIPTQLLAYIASGAFNQVDLSLTPDAAYATEVAQAKRQKRLPRYTGTDVLRGRITGPAIK